MRIMRHKLIYSFIYIIAGLGLFSGCSSRVVKHKLTDVKADNRKISAAAVLNKEDDFRIHPMAYNYFVNGLLYDAIGDIIDASENFKRALQYHPKSYQLRYSLAESYYKLQKYDYVISVLDIISPVDVDVYLLRGASYMALGEEDSAKTNYRKLVEIAPNNSSSYSHLAGLYRKQENLDSLIWAYENLNRIKSNIDRNWLELGRLYARRGDFQAAKTAFRKSIETQGNPTNILSYISLGEIYKITNQIDSAIIIYKAAVEINPTYPNIHKELSILYTYLDSLELALEYAHNVVKLSPLDNSNIRRIGILYFGLDSLKSADSILTYLVQSGEINSLDHYYLGRIAALEDDFERAVDEFTILTQLADSIAESWLDLGYAYRKLKRIDQEILTYRTGLNHISEEEDAIKLLFALGAAYEQDKQIEIAVTTFEEIIARSPEYAQALNYLGYMLADRGERLEYAKELIEKAVELSPDNVAFLDSYGWVYFRLGDIDKALIHLQKAVSLDSDPVIFDHLGDAFKAADNLEKAAIWWKKALELAPDNEKIKEKLSR